MMLTDGKIRPESRITWLAAMAFFVIFVLVSCSDDRPAPTAEVGMINPRLTVSNRVENASSPGDYITMANVPDATQFRLRLLETSTGKTAEWSSMSDFDMAMLYRTGRYRLSAYHGYHFAEGFDVPFYMASEEFDVTNGGRTAVALTARLGNAMLAADFHGDFDGLFESFSVVFHSVGGDYIEYPLERSGEPVFLRPGDVDIYFSMTLRSGGRRAMTRVASISGAKANLYYSAAITLSGDGATPSVILSFDQKTLADDIAVELSDELFDGQSPVIEAVGFESDVPITLVEGSLLDRRIAVEAGGTELSSLDLVIQSISLISDGLKAQYDLLSLSDGDAAQLRRAGLIFDIPAAGNGRAVIDFTDIISKLKISAERGNVNFIVTATSTTGQMADPVKLSLDLSRPDIEILEVKPPVFGINRARLVVNMPADDLRRNMVLETIDVHDAWQPIAIESIDDNGNGTSTVTFDVGGGVGDIDLRLYYCGTLRSKLTLRRESPSFSVEADAFAQSVALKIVGADPELLPLIVENVMAFDRSDQRRVITLRNVGRGEVIVSGLTPGTAGELTLSLFPHPVADGRPCQWVRFTTEAIQHLPNSDFEDIKRTIDVDNMPSGGRYSQMMVEIYNGQNTRSFHIDTPRRWANTNSKTFCDRASNRNTWYMQPSVSCKINNSNSYAVELRTVSWDLDGEHIADYLQTSEPFVKYSREVPHISWTSAGKLFLGNYTFDARTFTETYDEGIEFTSRPSAVNGFYTFVPCEAMPTDHGLVTIEVLGEIDGELKVIGSGRGELSFATGFTAFNVPVNYTEFGVKARRLKVMFASSVHIGTIDYETASIRTSPDPETASSVGGVLTIDNISLSY